MADSFDPLGQILNQGPAQVVGSLDENPDDAARAIQLEHSTGVPSAVINGDLEGFEKEHKARLAGEIIRGNPQLNAYVQSHPLAAAVSNDDYGALDQFSQSASQTSAMSRALHAPIAAVTGAASGAYEGAKEGFEGGSIEPFATAEDSRLGYTLKQSAWMPLNLLSKGMAAVSGAIMGGVGGGVRSGVLAAGGSVNTADKAAREAQGPIEYEMSKGEVTAETAAAPWLKEGIEPPTGAHPKIDQAKASANAQALESLDKDVAAAQQSATKERAPQMFEQFARQHYGDSEIGISGDAVAALYGEKAPAPGDGLLGDVPGIEEKLAVARETGADVRVPLTDWVSSVDSALHQSLHDDLRMWPGGITAREASALGEVEPTLDAPLPQVRGPAGLEPITAVGDRALALGQDGSLTDGTGASVGKLDLSLDGTDVRVGAVDGLDASGFGPSLTTSLGQQIKAQFPEAETINGVRLDDPAAVRDALEKVQTAAVMAQQDARLVASSHAELDEPTRAGEHVYKIMRGDEIHGVVKIKIDGKTARVEDMYGVSGLPEQMRGVLGTKQISGLLRQFLAEHPEVETLTGERVSGARRGGQHGFSGTGEEVSVPVASRKEVLAAAERDDQLKGSIEDQLARIKSTDTGLQVATWNKLKRQLRERFDEDVAASAARAARDIAKRQTAEWKDNHARILGETEESLSRRPDIAADNLLNRGELYGEKVGEPVRLLSSDLTEEQKAVIPRRYQSAEGLPTDAVASLFGYGSGDAMVAKLGELKAARDAVGMEPREFVRKLAKDLTDQEMEARYGQLHENILAEARGRALSDTNMELMATELKAAQEHAGVDTKWNLAALKQSVKDRFAGLPIGSVSSDSWFNLMGRHGKEAERALIAKDPAAAVVALEKKQFAALYAKEASKLEAEMKSFDRDTKNYAKREIPGVEPEYVPFVHQIMQAIGKPVRRSMQDIAAQISAGTAENLKDFAEQKAAELKEMPVWDQLFDSSWKKGYKDLTVQEFRNVRDSINTMIHNGRQERKIYIAGEAQDAAEVKERLLHALRQFPELTYDAKDQRPVRFVPQRVADGLRHYKASLTQIETLLNQWDHFDPKGDWNQAIMRGLIEGANQKDAWLKEFAKKILDTDDGVDLKKMVDNDIFKAQVGSPVNLKLNRGNLRAIMLNTGTESGLTKLARGRGLTEDQVMGWIHSKAAKEDWDWVQKIWGLFGEMKARSDTMYRSLSGGVAPESLPARAVDTPHGRYEGGYYPVIYAEEGQKSAKLNGKNALEEEGYHRATTPAGYTQSRTGYVGPVSLDIDQMPNRMKQVIHDTALRPAVINASKVFYDSKIQNEISGRYGKEYKDLLVPYLRDVANNSNFMSKAQKSAQSVSEFVRQNMISTLVGMNPGTVLKHGPTALVQSMHEVGTLNFLSAVKGLLSVDEQTGENNWQFAMKNSQELQRRHQHYEETLTGAVQTMVPTSAYDSLRRTVMKYSTMPVAMSDLLSAVPTWTAAYGKAIEEGSSHGDGVYLADRAVRRAHGSTSVTNRPGIMREASPWITSVYGFFNHILNRQMEMVWKAGEMIGEAKDGNYAKAMAAVPAMGGMVFAYALWPALVEHLVSGGGDPEEKKKSFARRASEAMIQTGGASFPIVRDFTSALAAGKDPTMGMGSTVLKTGTDVYRDLYKKQPMNKEHAGRLVQDASTMIGTMTGLVNETEGRAVRFMMSNEHPKGPWGWAVGLRSGTLKNHSQTFQDWRNGK